MRRHVPGHRGVVLLAFIFAAAILLGIVDNRVHQTPPPDFVMPPPNRFQVTEAPQIWHGQPVYRIQNVTDTTLQHVTPGSWSEQLIPILYVALKPPKDLAAIEPDVQPPINLKPGESMWIVSSEQSPYKLTITWMDHGHDRYQTYEIKGHSQ